MRLVPIVLCAGCLEFGDLVDIERLPNEEETSITTPDDTDETPIVEPVTWDVVIKDLAFEPEEITISAGDSVRWLMEDGGTFHFVTEGDPNAEPVFESPRLDIGDDYTHVFENQGVYVYHCANHSLVMRGATVTVE